jgi:histidinol-phosphatase (PHP family)
MVNPSPMLRFNYHTHTRYCDGKNDPEDYVREAIRLEMHSLGFSAHSPLPFDTPFALKQEELDDYCRHILSLRSRFADQIQIYLALELDYIPGISDDFNRFRDSYPLDYTIGSVHLVKPDDREGLWFIDGPLSLTYDSGLSALFDNDIRKAVTTYYYCVNQMIAIQKPDIIGHLDKIKMHNKGRFFSEDEDWYIRLVEETLDVIAQTGGIVEVNTRGIYKKRSDSLYPGPWILEKMKKLGIPVTISTDAHRPDELVSYFEETANLLKQIGYRTLWYLNDNKWEELLLV